MEFAYKIKNLDCANCAKKVERAIQKLPDVESANLTFMIQKLVVKTNNDKNIYDTILKEAKRIEPLIELIELEEI